MTRSELLLLILERLRLSSVGEATFTWGEIQRWPENAHKLLVRADLLAETTDARSTECPGCERLCPKSVQWRSSKGSPRSAFVYCNEPEGYGLFDLDRQTLNRWHTSVEQLAVVVARLLQFSTSVYRHADGRRWALGLLSGREHRGEVILLMEPDSVLIVDGRTIPLTHVLTLTNKGLMANKATLVRILDSERKQPRVGVGSRRWLKERAQRAADALHNQPGGTRDKQEKMRALWRSGAYPSRERCAERECKRLGMSYSAARRALTNVSKEK